MIDIAWAFIRRESVLPMHPPQGMVIIQSIILKINFYFYPKSYISELISQGHAQPLRKESKDGPYLSGGKFVPNQKVQDLRNRLIKFVEDRIYPMENKFYKLALSSTRWSVHPEEERLKELAKKEGLWNLFIPVCAAADKFYLSVHFPSK